MSIEYLVRNQYDATIMVVCRGAYNGVIMTNNMASGNLPSGNLESPSVLETCARVKHLGYTTSGRVRLYGEEFEVVSEPFAEADGIAVRVKSRKNPNVRTLRLPSTVVHTAKRRRVA
jgi:hypothetical protein